MFKYLWIMVVATSLVACGAEEPVQPQTPPTTKANDPGKALADQALVLSFNKEFGKAAPLFAQAAEQGNRPAQYYLGLLYARGEGVERDFKQAFAWLQKAAMGGHPKAVYHLAEMYVKGDGVEVDHIKAMAWFWVGTTLGDRYAEKRLRAVAPRLTPEEMGEAKTLSKELYAQIPHDLKIDRFSMH